MGAPLSTGFSVKSPVAVDDRLFLTREQMCNIDDNIMPAVYFCVCADDGAMYIYNKANEFIPYDEDGYGKYRKLNSGGGEEVMTVVFNKPIKGDIEPGKKIVWAHEDGGKYVGDVYVGLEDGQAVCTSSNERFVGMDDAIADKIGITLHDTSKKYNGWVDSDSSTIYITNINQDYDDVDALFADVKADAFAATGVEWNVAFDSDPVGNDLREYGRIIHD